MRRRKSLLPRALRLAINFLPGEHPPSGLSQVARHRDSAQSGPKVAAILSVIESCRRLGVPVKEYLLAVLPGIARRKLSEVIPLTPARWTASRN